jgi:dienelactone hydrolase
MSHVQSRSEVEASKIVVMGYCFGGLCALDLARAAPQGLVGAISIHGDLRPPGLTTQPKIEASVLVLHGWDDPIAPPADVLAICTELTEAGADWQLHAYGHAMHAFTFVGADMPEKGIKYDRTASERSWISVVNFLGETVGATIGRC